MDNVQYVDKVTQTWDDSFGTISVYKVVWNDPSGTPQTSYVLGVEHKSVGEKTSEGGEIFNDYANNMALSLHSFASGSATIAGGKGFEIVSQRAIYDNKTEEETITFNSPSTYDVTVKSGETQHIIKSVSTSNNIPISLVYHTTNAESVSGNMFYITSFPYRIDVTDSRYSGGYTIYDDNGTNQTINIEIERLSGQGLQLQNSFEASTTQDISAKHNDNTAIVIITQTGFDGAIHVNNSPISNSVEIDVSSLTINDTISIAAYGTPIYKVEYYENVPTGFGVYTLASTEGLEVGMPYSVKLSAAKYNAGVIATINGNDVTVDGYTYIEPYTEEEIASATSEYFRANYLTIVGRPELGDMDVGFNAVALGEDCIVQDRCGFATGCANKVIGQCGVAEGLHTIATAPEQHVQGRYNIEDTDGKYADIVGNGTSDSARSNAYTLDWDGNGWFSGEVECTNIILKSPNGTRFKISVDDNGNLSATKA